MTQSLRALMRRPGLTSVIVLTLMLGIGITTAVFSIFYGVLLSPLPFPDSHEIVAVYDTQPSCSTCPASFPKYHDWAERNTVFRSIGGSAPASFVLTGSGDPERVRAARTTASFADVFRTAPAIGRWYTPEEDQPGGRKVAVLSHGFWTRRFVNSSSAPGQILLLNGEPFEIIGVMPAGFVHGEAEIFVPLQEKLDPATRGSHFLPVFARLKPGVTVEVARREMQSLGHTLASEFGHNHGIDVQSWTEALVGQMRAPLRVLLGAVFLLLLIGTVNVANLLLASGLARRRELAVRMSLGAGTQQIAGMLLMEGLWLALAGGILGVLLSRWLVSVFVALAGNQLPRAAQIQVDWPVLAFASVLSVAVGILCSLFPIMLLRRPDLAYSLREGDVRGGSHSGNRTRRVLVVSEIALAFGLLVCSALLIKNLLLLSDRDAGVRTARIVAFDVGLHSPRYGIDSEVRTFYRELYHRLNQIDLIRSVGFVSHLPMVSFGYNGEFQVEGSAPWPERAAPLVEYRWIYGDYLKTVGIPLLRGRMLDQRDGASSRTVLVNKAMAEKFWPSQDPVGRRFGQGRDRSEWFEVVGVIGNVRSYGLTQSHPFEFYRTVEQSAFRNMTVVVETSAEDPLSIVPLARQTVLSLDSALPISDVQTMEKAVADSLGRPRFMSALSGLFGALAGLLAMVGVYSLMAYNVSRQRREYGIRLALGADRRSLERLVLGQGLLLALAGIAIGAILAAFATHLLQSVLHDVRPGDPAVFTGTAAAVALVSVVACWLPARSAGRVDPMEILRTE